MKTLVLAEKPSVGKELGRVLGCTMAKDGYMENKQYVVTWAFGHLVELADPSEYDKRYGFIYVDREEFDLKTLDRYRKDSFYWYKKVIATNGDDLSD